MLNRSRRQRDHGSFVSAAAIAHLAPELTRALAVDLPDAVAAGRRQRNFFAFRNDA